MVFIPPAEDGIGERDEVTSATRDGHPIYSNSDTKEMVIACKPFLQSRFRTIVYMLVKTVRLHLVSLALQSFFTFTVHRS